MNEIKKNDLIKARELFNILRFIDDLYSINCGGESQIILIPIRRSQSYSKEGTGNHETSFLDLNIKTNFKRFNDPARQVMYHLTFCNQSLITAKSNNNQN